MGEVGKYITSVLVDEGHNVTIVDEDANTLKMFEENMDVLAWCGNGATLHGLTEIRASDADWLIATSNRDETNLLAGILAKKMGCQKTIARVSNREHMPSEKGVHYSFFDIDQLISPEILTAIEITTQVRSVGTLRVENFADNRIELVLLAIDEKSQFTNRSLSDVPLQYVFGKRIVVGAILREGVLLIPSGADAMMPGDEVFLIGQEADMGEIEKKLGKTRRCSAHRVMLIGGGEIGFSVAKELEQRNIKIILIEKDPVRAEELGTLLDRTTVLNGDGTHLRLLEEERAGNCDVFITMSPEDDTNLMAGLLAKKLGCKKVVALVHRPDYEPIYEQLGIDAAISPRLLVARQILKHVREGEVASVSVMADGQGEILELVVPEECRIADKPLIDVNFPCGARIGVVAWERGVYVPDGNDIIRPGNTVVVFTTPEVRPAVEHLFRKSSIR